MTLWQGASAPPAAAPRRAVTSLPPDRPPHGTRTAMEQSDLRALTLRAATMPLETGGRPVQFCRARTTRHPRNREPSFPQRAHTSQCCTPPSCTILWPRPPLWEGRRQWADIRRFVRYALPRPRKPRPPRPHHQCGQAQPLGRPRRRRPPVSCGEQPRRYEHQPPPILSPFPHGAELPALPGPSPHRQGVDRVSCGEQPRRYEHQPPQPPRADLGFCGEQPPPFARLLRRKQAAQGRGQLDAPPQVALPLGAG